MLKTLIIVGILKLKITIKMETNQIIVNSFDSQKNFKKELNPDFVFENCWEGKNVLPVNVLKSIHLEIDNPKNSPIILYGKSGTGKTYLAQCYANYVSKNYPEKQVFYNELPLSDSFFKFIDSGDWRYSDTNFEDLFNIADVLIMDLPLEKTLNYSVYNRLKNLIECCTKTGFLIPKIQLILLFNENLRVVKNYNDYGESEFHEIDFNAVSMILEVD
jgi:Cdc6-like AAA superfamily ATPase